MPPCVTARERTKPSAVALLQRALCSRDARNDTLIDDWGNDWLYGQDGNDSLDGGANDDFMVGGAGADAFNGGSGNNFLIQ